VTATVPSVPLIASSIVSKKLAGGAGGFVFDVKCGDGAFMDDLEKARYLARALVDLSRSHGKRSNASEVLEALAVLQGKGPEDTRELCLILGGAMVFLGGRARSLEEGRDLCRRLIDEGKGLEKMEQLLLAQGVSAEVVAAPHRFLPKPSKRWDIRADCSGWLCRLEARAIGEAVKVMGGGRMRKDDAIDPAVSVELHRKRGESIETGDLLMSLHYNDEARLGDGKAFLRRAFTVGEKPQKRPLVLDRIID
jgi:pyrimidine-nucleoside phosphorylase